MSAEVVYLSEFRQKRDAEKNPVLADSISPEEGYEIAQDVVQMYSAHGSLLKAFLERQKRESSNRKVEELHSALMRQRTMVGGYSTYDLKALLASYQKTPEYYYETYILPVAEEYQYRFDAGSREEA